MDTEFDDESELMNLRAVARALVLERQPEQYVVYMGEDGKPIFDPFVRYGPYVVVVPEKLSLEQWSAKYAHLAGRPWRSDAQSQSAEARSPTDSATERHPTTGSPSHEKAAPPIGVRPRSRFRP
jgi:hypothetical protein